MICAGLKMDQIIQNAGIDKNTTIVITTMANGSYYVAMRAYFAFRYWGFPKERLKVLNGYNKAFKAQYLAYMTTVAPVVTVSTHSVRNNPGLRADLRTSLGEMIQVVNNPANAQFVDQRSSAAFSGTAKQDSGIFITVAPKDYVVFEGRIAGAVNVDAAQLQDAANNNKLKSAADLTTYFTSLGLTSGKRTYAYCYFGTQASLTFFVLDAVLNWPVELYDGSWSQWGLYDDNAGNGGKLTAGSAWKTIALSTNTAYNLTALGVGETIADFTAAAGYDATVAAAYSSDTTSSATNQIEIEDATYLGTGSGGGGGGGGGGGC
jgi:3-mercaptopyruvate sulfurtransferase SseA